MIDSDHCPNCKAFLVDENEYYEEPELFSRFYRSWYYICPNCNKEYVYTRYYACIHEEMREIKEVAE